MQNKTKLIFGVSAVAVIIAILFLTGTARIDKGKELSDENNIVASTTEKTIGGVTNVGTGDFKVEQVPINEITSTIKVPNLNRPLNFPIGFSSEVKIIVEQRITDNIAKLKKDPTDVDEWLSLGINRKMVNDFEGAKEAWEYAGFLSPKLAVIFSNLGDLYGYYLKDNVKAEKNYLKAIANDSLFSNYYIRTADFYREIMNDLEKSRVILLKGASVIKDDVNIMNALEQINTLILDKQNKISQ